ncbi:hypothetical protein NE237_005028 [Protea cynaroides]|uniref:Uncharacterized protein n=1 Tax=Protea cynaroides TaxID=273540 RepID=A0A9Q0KK19_9MAGN|nr:hypothetical protein NE237_005028 [Protea cynaroides]
MTIFTLLCLSITFLVASAAASLALRVPVAIIAANSLLISSCTLLLASPRGSPNSEPLSSASVFSSFSLSRLLREDVRQSLGWAAEFGMSKDSGIEDGAGREDESGMKDESGMGDECGIEGGVGREDESGMKDEFGMGDECGIEGGAGMEDESGMRDGCGIEDGSGIGITETLTGS